MDTLRESNRLLRLAEIRDEQQHTRRELRDGLEKLRDDLADCLDALNDALRSDDPDAAGALLDDQPFSDHIANEPYGQRLGWSVTDLCGWRYELKRLQDEARAIGDTRTRDAHHPLFDIPRLED